MFDNIGKKIKALTKISCWIGIFASLITGFIFLSIDEELFLIIGLPIMIGGPLLFWISSFFMYGFGELIDKACDIEKNTRGNAAKNDPASMISV